MLRPYSRLFNIASDTPSAGGGISGLVMKHIAAGDSTVAKLASVTAAIAAPAKPEGGGEGAAGGDDEGAGDGAGEDDEPAAEEADPSKPAAEPAEGAEDEGADDEIKPEDDAETQLKKLRASQKKTLRRLDKIAAERNELKDALAKHVVPAEEAPAPGDALGHVKTAEELDATSKQIDAYLAMLAENAAKGVTVKGPKGEDIQLSPEDVVGEILHWSDVKAKQVPSKRAFLAERAKAQTEASEKFKTWTAKQPFITAKAEVENGMKGTKALMADYDLAVHERTLGRLAISGDYDLVPKRKATASGVESAPVKPKPPATPVVPPNSGGPPIKPAGSGPDLDQLRQNMAKNPGNLAAVQAFVKASISTGK